MKRRSARARASPKNRQQQLQKKKIKNQRVRKNTTDDADSCDKEMISSASFCRRQLTDPSLSLYSSLTLQSLSVMFHCCIHSSPSLSDLFSSNQNKNSSVSNLPWPPARYNHNNWLHILRSAHTCLYTFFNLSRWWKSKTIFKDDHQFRWKFLQHFIYLW